MAKYSEYQKWKNDRLTKAAVEGATLKRAFGQEGVVIRGLGSHRMAIRWRGDYTLENSELIFSAASRLANTLSAIPLYLYKGTKRISDELTDLVSCMPNPNMATPTFIRAMEACRATAGNGYALKTILGDGTLDRIDVIDPTRVTPIVERTSKELWYRIRLDNEDPFYIHNYYILHVSFLSTNGIIGISPLSVLFNSMNYYDGVQEFSKDQLESGVNAKFVLEAPSSLGDARRKILLDKFTETYKETSSQILLLESGITAKTLNLSPVDSKLFEVEKISRSKVAMVYNIPPFMMGDYDSTSYASQEQAMLYFLMTTMLPIVTLYESEWNRKLLTQTQRIDGYQWKFDMDSMLRADAGTRADVNQKALRGGWRLLDEIRAEEHREAYPDGMGKIPLAARDLAPLSRIISNPDLPKGGEE